MRRLILVLLSDVLLASSAFANPYDDCILAHMGTAQNQAAVYEIERACISKTSVPIGMDQYINLVDPRAYPGIYNVGYSAPEPGLEITFTNSTPYDITGIRVDIQDKKTAIVHGYLVDSFSPPLPPGEILTGLAEPSLAQIIKSGASADFFVEIPEVGSNPKDFSKNYSWDAIAVKGIPGS